MLLPLPLVGCVISVLDFSVACGGEITTTIGRLIVRLSQNIAPANQRKENRNHTRETGDCTQNVVVKATNGRCAALSNRRAGLAIWPSDYDRTQCRRAGHTFSEA